MINWILACIQILLLLFKIRVFYVKGDKNSQERFLKHGILVLSWPKFVQFFLCNGSGSAQVSLALFDSFVRLCCDSCHISMHFKKSSKLVNFCAAMLILKMGENTHFWRIILYYLKKSKNATEMQKRICAACGEGAVTDRMCQKWFAKFLGTMDFLAK